jgi:hypothetical protein
MMILINKPIILTKIRKFEMCQTKSLEIYVCYQSQKGAERTFYTIYNMKSKPSTIYTIKIAFLCAPKLENIHTHTHTHTKKKKKKKKKPKNKH